MIKLSKQGYEPKNGKLSKLSDEQLKDEIHERVFAYAEFMPNVKSREDILNVFKELGYKVKSKPTDKYISIEHPDKKNNPELKNLRFKDEIYSREFDRSMLNKGKSYKQLEYERKRPERIAKAQKIYDSSLQKRIERMTHRYRNIERKPLDNQLTKDLAQIRASNEPEFLKQVAEWQRAELKKIIGQTIEQIYKQHEHDSPEQLANLKNLHELLIDDIDSRIQDKPLPQFDEVIAQYTNSKNHVVTLGTIEHDRRQAQLEQQQAELARLAQLEQQQAFERKLLSQNQTLHTDELLPDESYQRFNELDDKKLAYNKQSFTQKLQPLLDKAQHELLDEQELSNVRKYQAVLNSIDDIERNRLQLEQSTQTTETDPELNLNKERSDKEVAQPDLDQPEQITITLNQRQQIVFDIASKHFPDDNLDEMQEYVSSLSDSELRNIENPHQAKHDEYVKLANSYAKSIQDNLIKKSELELSKLKTLVPDRPDHTKMSAKAWDKAFKQWEIDRFLPQANVRNKEIEINNLKNQIVKTNFTHFEKIAKDRPDLSSNEQEYEHFQQFVDEVNRALNELDQQQQQQPSREQVKQSDLDI